MTINDSDLITKAQNGDIAAFETLIYKYDQNVLSIALKFVKDEDDAKDIYQEVFIRVFKGLKKFHFNSEFSTWIYRITANVCLTFKSRKKKRTFVSINQENPEGEEFDIPIENDHSSSPEKYMAAVDFTESVMSAMEYLPKKQKMAFTLKYMEGYKIREIAEIMDCKEGTIKKYLFDASGKLRNQLSHFNEK